MTAHVYEQGDLVTCIATFAIPPGASSNPTAIPVDPTIVGFIARNPLGSLAASAAYNAVASVVKVATGAYRYDVPIPISTQSIGNWTYGFRATGGYVGATPDAVFEVKRTAL